MRNFECDDVYRNEMNWLCYRLIDESDYQYNGVKYVHMSFLYLLCSDQSQESKTRHQDLPLRVSQDTIGKEDTTIIYIIAELLLLLSRNLFLTCFIRFLCFRLCGRGVKRP